MLWGGREHFLVTVFSDRDGNYCLQNYEPPLQYWTTSLSSLLLIFEISDGMTFVFELKHDFGTMKLWQIERVYSFIKWYCEHSEINRREMHL